MVVYNKLHLYLLGILSVVIFSLVFFTQIVASSAVNPALIISATGYSPSQIKAAYNIPSTGGRGLIAVIDAFHYPNLENDLAQFDTKYGIASCTKANGCLKVIWPGSSEPPVPTGTDAGWNEEVMLDVEWAHAIAPNAKILLVETNPATDPDFMQAVELAKSTPGVVSISMSWGAPEFNGQNSQIDPHFSGSGSFSYFAASGDCGGVGPDGGPEVPAAVSTVTAIGGTSLVLNSNGTINSETAWGGSGTGLCPSNPLNNSYGSGGGLSKYESIPTYQQALGIPYDSTNKRALPDVALNADPKTGYSIYYNGKFGSIGGTSAATPIVAAMNTLAGTNITNGLLYANAGSNFAGYYWDVTRGINGGCGLYCSASNGYDYVTGLGSFRNLPQSSPLQPVCVTSGGKCVQFGKSSGVNCGVGYKNNPSDISCGNPDSIACCMPIAISAVSPTPIPFPTTPPNSCPPDASAHTYSQTESGGVVRCYANDSGLGFNTIAKSTDFFCGPVSCPGFSVPGQRRGHICIVKETSGNCYSGYGVSGFDDVNTYAGKDYCVRDAAKPISCPNPIPLYVRVEDSLHQGISNIQLTIEYADKVTSGGPGQIITTTTDSQGNVIIPDKLYSGDHFIIIPNDPSHSYLPSQFGNKNSIGQLEMNTTWSCGLSSKPCIFTQGPPGPAPTATSADCFTCQSNNPPQNYVCTDSITQNSSCSSTDTGGCVFCGGTGVSISPSPTAPVTSPASTSSTIYSPNLTLTFVIFGVIAFISLFL